jgi:molybdopterin synthase sulfur carrier subunit
MTITVKLFAILRDTAGVPELLLTLPDGTTVATAVQTLLVSHPTLAPFAARIACAVNLTRVARDTVLQDGDELALLPPVSGG